MNWGVVFTAMLPEHFLLVGIVVLMGVEIGSRRPRGAAALSLVALAAATSAAAWLHASGYAAAPFAGQYSVDSASSLTKAVVLGLAVPVVLLARDEFERSRFYLLVLASLYGACMILSADSLLTLFLGLELMSLPVYVLVLLAFRRPESAEAALKYLVLSGAATATFLMGVSLLYGATGSLALAAFTTALGCPADPLALAAFTTALGCPADPLAQAAVVLVVVAFFLKAAVVPFHAWAPDAYEAASVPVTAYMATIIKAVVLLAVVRLFGTVSLSGPLVDLVAILPLASIVWGNLAAMRQSSFRRLIAYSSIAHAGYLFYAFLDDGPGRFQAVVFYVLAYGLMNLLAFASLPPAADDAARDRLDHLRGLFQRNPYSAIMIGIAMLSLAGIPPLPGFIAKFLIFKNVMAAGYTLYAVLGLVASYLGIYFYLRVIQYLFMSPEGRAADRTPAHGIALGASVLCLVAALLLAVMPGLVLTRL